MSNVMKAVPLVVLCALIIAGPPVWANWIQDDRAICTAAGNQYSPTITSDGAGGRHCNVARLPGDRLGYLWAESRCEWFRGANGN